MRQVWIARTGEPEVLEVREVPEPEPRLGEVRVRVEAAGVTFSDVLARLGLDPDAPTPPATVGYEVAGVVDRVGPGVEGVEPGTAVVALLRAGGYAEMVRAPAQQVVPLPASVPPRLAAAVPVDYLTAWLVLVWLGHVRDGEWVLVHAANSGVGMAAAQICRWRGARVLATADVEHHPRLLELGVSHCVDPERQDFEAEIKRITRERGVDIAMDALGGESFRKSYRSLAPLGRLFLYGLAGHSSGRRRGLLPAARGLARLPRVHPASLTTQNRGVIGVSLGHLWSRAELLGQMMREILRLVEQGVLEPVVDRAFPLDRVAEAHAYVQARKGFGKVLLLP